MYFSNILLIIKVFKTCFKNFKVKILFKICTTHITMHATNKYFSILENSLLIYLLMQIALPYTYV